MDGTISARTEHSLVYEAVVIVGRGDLWPLCVVLRRGSRLDRLELMEGDTIAVYRTLS